MHEDLLDLKTEKPKKEEEWIEKFNREYEYPLREDADSQIHFDGWLLQGLLGSTARERQDFPEKNYRRILKKMSKLHRETRLPIKHLFKIERSTLGKTEVFQSTEPDWDETLKKLAELTSLYPNLPLRLSANLPDSIYEGKNSSKGIRSYLIWIHYSIKDIFWKSFFLEKVQGIIEKSKYEGKAWNDSREMLSLILTPELLELYLEARFPDKVSIEKSIQYINKTLFFSEKSFLSYIDSGGYIQRTIRKKGYNDKGSTKSDKTSSQYGLDTLRGRYIYNYDLINWKGEYLMDSDHYSLKEILLELHSESLESLLQFIKKRNREADIFQQQDFEEIHELLHRQDLTPEEKIERMMANERTTKKRKPDLSLQKLRAEEKKSLRVYKPERHEDTET